MICNNIMFVETYMQRMPYQIDLDKLTATRYRLKQTFVIHNIYKNNIDTSLQKQRCYNLHMTKIKIRKATHIYD